MPTHKIVALNLVQKIQKQELEDQATVLNGLHYKISEFQAQKDIYLTQLQNDTHSPSIESAPYVDAFIRSVKAQIALIDRELFKLTAAADAIEDAVRSKFQDMKTFSLVLENAVEKKFSEQKRAENKEMEDYTIMRWRK